jgi:hypothetical protein
MNVRQWTKTSPFHHFVQDFFDQKDLFASHEIEYLKNNCESYPGVDYEELNEFQKLVDQIDLDDIREKTKERLDKSDTSRKIKINNKNPFRETWDNYYNSGMYEKQDGVGMFGSEEDWNHMIKYLDENE